jgi:hypothetical protein
MNALYQHGLTAAPDVREGDIWKEVDPRMERFVRVASVGTGRRSVAIRTVVLAMGQWRSTARSRLVYADRDRFNGKRSGYALHYREQT